MVAFLADECFSGRLVRALILAGFDVVRSAESHPSAPDVVVLQLAFDQGRVLLTEDNDFGELAVRLGLPTHGVVRVDLKMLGGSAREARLVAALRSLGEKVEGALVTVEPSRSRVRKLI